MSSEVSTRSRLSHILRRLPVVCAVLAASCGGDDPSPGDDDDASSSDDAASDGSSGNTSGSVPGETSSDASSGTSADTASDDESTDAGADTSSSTGDDALECASSQTRLVGELGGRSLDAEYMARGFSADFELGNVKLWFGTDGALFMYPTEGDPTTAAAGYLFMPERGPHAGSWHCIGDESSIAFDDDAGTASASLVDVVELGGCAGTPVEGALVLCLAFGGECGDAAPVTSTIEGASFEVPLAGEGFTSLGMIGSNAVTYDLMIGATAGGWAALHATDVEPGPGSGTSPVDHAYFTIPMGLPDAGAVYCATGSLAYENGDPVRAVLSEVTRVGSCADATSDDALDVCFSQ